METVNIVLYENFTALDVFGPVEVLSGSGEFQLRYVSLDGGVVSNSQSIRIETEPMARVLPGEVVLIPGGYGSRQRIREAPFIEALRRVLRDAEYVLCVCTGSALAAETGILNGRRATSNKIAFSWVADNHPDVTWVREARWVRDGNCYTSAGVSAGIDMALGFVRDRFGEEKAREVCRRMEYHWNSESEHDLF